MFEKEEKINIVIGESLLWLLQTEADISSELLTDRLQRVLETETEEDMRQTIADAIRQINRLSGAGENNKQHLHKITFGQVEQRFHSHGKPH